MNTGTVSIVNSADEFRETVASAAKTADQIQLIAIVNGGEKIICTAERISACDVVSCIDRTVMTPIQKTAICVFREIGIPSHIKGYRYMLEAVQLAAEKQITAGNIAKELYAPIAERFQTTPERVNRAIRHAIEVLGVRGDSTILQSYFGPSSAGTKEMLSNAECITLLTEKIRLMSSAE